MSNAIKVTFEYEDKIIRDPLSLGDFEPDQEGQIFDIYIKHNSNRSIRDCNLFISPYVGIYPGTSTKRKDYEKTSWYGDNYENYGLSIAQEYVVYGEVYRQESGRLIDVDRDEEKDFFTGFDIEILSGPIAGEKRTITGYNYENNMFTLEDDFSINVDGERYKIELKTIDYIKSQNGTSINYPIPLLHNGGKINRFEKVKIQLQMKIPPYMKSSAVSYFNLNMQFTPEEI